jgi:hypothetical protein
MRDVARLTGCTWKVRKYLDALCVFFWASTPVLFLLCTFSAFIAMGGDLDPAKVLPT